MQIQQRCHDCQELLLVPEPRYREMMRAGGRAICPACGASVKPHDPVSRHDKQERAHPVKLFSIPEYVPPPPPPPSPSLPAVVNAPSQNKKNHQSKTGAPRKKAKPKRVPSRIVNLAPAPMSFSKYQDRPQEYKTARPLESLRRDVINRGRVFVLSLIHI